MQRSQELYPAPRLTYGQPTTLPARTSIDRARELADGLFLVTVAVLTGLMLSASLLVEILKLLSA